MKKNIPSCFRSSISTLHKVSYDDKNGVYLSRSHLPVLDFDAIKDWYSVNVLGHTHAKPASNDALFVSDERIVFIEFKNTKKVHTWARDGLAHKIYDSVLLLLDSHMTFDWCRLDWTCSLDYIRSHLEYVFVYNREKRENGRQRLQRNLNHLGKFDLGWMEGFLFSKVLIYNCEDFQQQFVRPEERKRMKRLKLQKYSGNFLMIRRFKRKTS